MQFTKIKSAALVAGLVISLSTPALALEAPESFADLVEDLSPTVVNIQTDVSIPASGGQLELPPNIPPFFRDFFENNPDFQQREPRKGRQAGSGFIIDGEGYIVTNNHVIENAESITVETFDNQQLSAELIGRDPKTDIALLKVEPEKPLKATSFGDSDEVRVGDWVMAIGNPLNQGFSVSAGIVSARNRSLSGAYDDFIQTDAAINRGNSGGPLFNTEGEVVGVNTAILSPNGGSIGIGFAMSSRVVSQVVAQLKEFGQTKRGWLGVQIQPLTEDIAEAMGLDNTDGVLVNDVPEGPAQKAGIKTGDVILKFDGKEIDDVEQLVREVGNTEVGKAVPVEIYRFTDNENLKIDVTLGRLEDATDVATSDETEEPKSEETAEGDVLGMSLQKLTPSLAEEMGIAQAGGLLVMAVEPGSIADTRGIQAGDVIRGANRAPVNEVKELEDAVKAVKKDGRDAILMIIDRNETSNFVAVPVE